MNDYVDPNESEGMKNMRKQLKELAKQNKALLEAQQNWDTQNRSTVISQALTSRGLDAKVAKFYPVDLGADDESVDKWYNENKDVFGPVQPTGRSSESETTLSDAEQRGYQAMTDMEAYDARVVQDFKSQIDQIKYDPLDPQKAERDLLALLEANGVNLTSM
jgi:hypothetical protein